MEIKNKKIGRNGKKEKPTIVIGKQSTLTFLANCLLYNMQLFV